MPIVTLTLQLSNPTTGTSSLDHCLLSLLVTDEGIRNIMHQHCMPHQSHCQNGSHGKDLSNDGGFTMTALFFCLLFLVLHARCLNMQYIGVNRTYVSMEWYYMWHHNTYFRSRDCAPRASPKFTWSLISATSRFTTITTGKLCNQRTSLKMPGARLSPSCVQAQYSPSVSLLWQVLPSSPSPHHRRYSQGCTS